MPEPNLRPPVGSATGKATGQTAPGYQQYAQIGNNATLAKFKEGPYYLEQEKDVSGPYTKRTLIDMITGHRVDREARIAVERGANSVWRGLDAVKEFNNALSFAYKETFQPITTGPGENDSDKAQFPEPRVVKQTGQWKEKLSFLKSMFIREPKLEKDTIDKMLKTLGSMVPPQVHNAATILPQLQQALYTLIGAGEASTASANLQEAFELNAGGEKLTAKAIEDFVGTLEASLKKHYPENYQQAFQSGEFEWITSLVLDLFGFKKEAERARQNQQLYRGIVEMKQNLNEAQMNEWLGSVKGLWANRKNLARAFKRAMAQGEEKQLATKIAKMKGVAPEQAYSFLQQLVSPDAPMSGVELGSGVRDVISYVLDAFDVPSTKDLKQQLAQATSPGQKSLLQQKLSHVQRLEASIASHVQDIQDEVKRGAKATVKGIDVPAQGEPAAPPQEPRKSAGGNYAVQEAILKVLKRNSKILEKLCVVKK